MTGETDHRPKVRSKGRLRRPKGGPSISIHLARGKCPAEYKPEAQERNGRPHEGTRKDLLAGNDTDWMVVKLPSASVSHKGETQDDRKVSL